MGAIAKAATRFRNVASAAPIAIQPWMSGRAQLPDAKYNTYATEGYAKNELVYAAIEELATSAAEPRMRAMIGKEWGTDHPILSLLNRPNPFMDRFEFWATVIMHRSLAGNAYALIVRSRSGKPVELWMLRPDRMAVVPDSSKYIARYEYNIGQGEPIRLPVEDVIHFKTRNPLNDFYGMPPLMAAAGRVDIDNFMKDFVKTFFEKAGVPAGMLNVEGTMDAALKKEIKDRFASEYGGRAGWHGLMVIESKKASFTPMTANMGPSGLVVPELDEINEARILMVFGVPPELIGARVGMQNSSYAQKRSARESFWDETLAPLYQEMAGPVNLRLVPNFPGVTEVGFDMTDVRALQEDIDGMHARERSDYNSGGITLNEFRVRTGRKPVPGGDTYLVPANLTPMTAERLGEIAAVAGDVKAGVPEQGAPPPTTGVPAQVPA